MKISYEIRKLMNSEKGIKFAKNYNFKMAPFLISSLASTIKITYEISSLTNSEKVSNSQKIMILKWPLS
jgi:hypothetical protein